MNPFYRVRMISNFPACDHEIDLFLLPRLLRDGCNSTGEITTRALTFVKCFLFFLPTSNLLSSLY